MAERWRCPGNWVASPCGLCLGRCYIAQQPPVAVGKHRLFAKVLITKFEWFDGNQSTK